MNSISMLEHNACLHTAKWKISSSLNITIIPNLSQNKLHTWNLRIMVHIKPRVSLELPSTMSWAPKFSKWTFCSYKNCSALSTFSRQWILIFPFVGLGWKKKKIEDLENFLSEATTALKLVRLISLLQHVWCQST